MKLGEHVIEIIHNHRLTSECIGFDSEDRPILTLVSDEEIKDVKPEVKEEKVEEVKEVKKEAPKAPTKKPASKKKPTAKKK